MTVRRSGWWWFGGAGTTDLAGQSLGGCESMPSRMDHTTASETNR